MQQVTWKFIEENLFPLVVQDARRVGMDTTGWAMDSREGPGRMFCRLAENKAVATVWHRFQRPEHADRFFQGVRWALSHVPSDKADAIKTALEYLFDAPDSENVNKASQALMAVHDQS